jgi:hypothetical protein
MSFDYNTQRKKMSLPEYGRNVLKMIEHIKTIKDPEERNRAARSIIQIMSNLNPNLREVTDYKHKLWDHLMIIADFDLNVDSPSLHLTEQSLMPNPTRFRTITARSHTHIMAVSFLHSLKQPRPWMTGEKEYLSPHPQPDEEGLHHMEQGHGG